MVLIILTLIGGDSQTYRIVQTALLILVAPAGIVLTIQLIAYWICAIFHTNSLKDRVVDTVIILGAGLNGDQVTPLLAARLNQGLKVANRTAGETDATFIVSGGQGNDETISEAEAMKSYLIKKGIDPDRILAEEDSTTTLENITFSKNLMEERNISPQGLAIVTNNFHVLRTASIAKSLNLESITIGSPTALYYYPSAFLREYAAMVVHFRRPTIALSTMPTIVMTAAYLTQWAIQ
ncbi:hypothetical protein BJF89_17430 [Corynebacterium sp. CNJ-954]|nr:hypothetical protein BJF89_17430 [Corynebacterium sp. CNJ-954]